MSEILMWALIVPGAFLVQGILIALVMIWASDEKE